jgi:hypothetical protein
MKGLSYRKEKGFYDGWVINQVKDWLYMNPRQRKAVETAISFHGADNASAIEFGSGIGVCGELFARETLGHVTSIDLSTELVRVGNRLFGSKNHEYLEVTIQELTKGLNHKVDLILLIDVLEHIRRNDWDDLFNAFGSVLSEEGQIFISTPTPRYQLYLKENLPSGLQPVDLSIEREELELVARGIGLKLVRYEEVDIYREGDYQYFTLSRMDRSVERKNLQEDGLMRRHWLLFWKWPSMYIRAFSFRMLWVALKAQLRGGRKIQRQDSFDAA